MTTHTEKLIADNRCNRLADVCEVLLSELDAALTRAYNYGVAAGILKDKADHCTDDHMLGKYLERMAQYQESFKKIHGEIFAKAEQIAGGGDANKS